MKFFTNLYPFLHFPVILQSVECAVKFASTSSKQLYGQESRHSFISAVCKNMNNRKQFETKKRLQLIQGSSVKLI